MEHATLVEKYTAAQQDWLDRMSTLDATSTQWDIVLTFRDLLLSQTNPLAAAKRIAELILSHPNVMEAYDYTLGCFLEAVEFFPSNNISSLLAAFLATLAGLPDATNQREEPLLWHHLPRFSLWLRERMNGPEAYLSRGDSPETAKATWKNINTFVAILFRDHGTKFPELFGPLVTYAFATLADALESSPRSRLGRNVPLHLPAAYQWILLAGVEVYNAVKERDNEEFWSARAGQLWTREGVRDEVDEKRWCFWMYRFGELKADARLDAAMNWEAAQAELRMENLAIGWNSES
ncbi:hypothetical protein M436DRAFT_57476 [Aureobasidium namibiae CBS 147.97]|uniref:Uncharacterized protein n=1 Tax=Aureobasidium namibiae CBS 147.97 TaxID=1043004 RepID=A0A074W6S6_9PEZI|nr:uncharacterized protein M436DRAFT_57476 [Aureobasidium namibiae CBS 147.97]KEQ68825.1 hypothetical protein M436DRAFT_57476 [Aureobasidium namibiae CBS 147.97]